MRKTTGKDSVEALQSTLQSTQFDPDGLLRHGPNIDDSALLAEYLNALLASHPPLIFDNCDRSDAYSEQGRASVKVVNNALYFEPQPDTDSLRGEIDALKLKVARLIAEVNEKECLLDAAQAQNESMQQHLASLKIQLELSKTVTRTATRMLQVDSAHSAEPRPAPRAPEPFDLPLLFPEAADATVPEAETSAPPPEIPAPLQFAEPETTLREEEEAFDLQDTTYDAPEASTAEEPTLQVAIEPPNGAEPADYEPQGAPDVRQMGAPGPQDAVSFRIELPKPEPVPEAKTSPEPGLPQLPPQSAVTHPGQTTGRDSGEPAPREAAIPSSGRGPSSKPPVKKPASKVLKQQDIKKVVPARSGAEAAKPQPLPALQTQKPVLQAVLQPELLEEQPPAVDQEIPQGTDQQQAKDIPDFAYIDPTTEIEPAPLPKSVVRRTFNSYMAIQAEADASSASHLDAEPDADAEAGPDADPEAEHGAEADAGAESHPVPHR